jgi:hypothetical protein
MLLEVCIYKFSASEALVQYTLNDSSMFFYASNFSEYLGHYNFIPCFRLHRPKKIEGGGGINKMNNVVMKAQKMAKKQTFQIKSHQDGLKFQKSLENSH